MMDGSELELGGVDGVGLPAFGDDVLLLELLASLAGDADGDGALDGLGGVDPPDGAPGVLEGLVLLGALLLDVDADDVFFLNGIGG